MTSSTFASLPVELLQAILSQSRDSFSLRALALSTTSFYRAFLATRSSILLAVLHNEFSEGTLRAALLTLASARLRPHIGDSIQKLLAQFQSGAALIPDSWSLSDSLELSRLRHDVGYFARDFSSTLCTNLVTGLPEENQLVLTSTEMDRIERAFYRFELYCNLIRDGAVRSISSLEAQEIRTLVVDRFLPWENEQLASVYEYLWWKLSIPFNDVAEHDIEWGNKSIRYMDDSPSSFDDYPEHYLALGLGWLHQLVTADTYSERYHMLAPELKYSDGALTRALTDGPYLSSVDPQDFNDVAYGRLSEDDRRKLYQQIFVEDDDIGPMEAWQWAYQGEAPDFFRPEQEQLRKRGYVMFDYDRLCQWGLFAKPFDAGEALENWRKLNVQDSDERFEQITRSWAERSKVWLRGGRGWWSEGDESRLAWPDGKARL